MGFNNKLGLPLVTTHITMKRNQQLLKIAPANNESAGNNHGVMVECISSKIYDNFDTLYLQ